MAMKRTLFQELGGFDESYPSATDVDFCWRAQLLGASFLWSREAVVIKRPKTSGGWRQHYSFGLDDVRLFSNFRDRGMRRQWRLAMKSWGFLVAYAPVAAVHPTTRQSWIRLSGRCIGRLRGSAYHRALYV
jgi:GT2 family glycosyltransferase